MRLETFWTSYLIRDSLDPFKGNRRKNCFWIVHKHDVNIKKLNPVYVEVFQSRYLNS